jgi:hypothetical protein
VVLQVPVEKAVECRPQDAGAEGARKVLNGFSGFQKSMEKQNEEACRPLRTQSAMEFKRADSLFQKRARDYLLGSAPSDDVGRTSITMAVRRLLEGSNVVVALSDLVETVEKRPLAKIAIPRGKSLYLVALPADPRFGGTSRTEQAIKEWQIVAPEAKVIFYPELAMPKPW